MGVGTAVIESRVLGPVEFVVAGAPVRLERTLERALATRLALAAGTPVSDRVLVEALWGPAELSRPGGRLRVLVSRLRSALGPHGGELRRVAGGYQLDATATDLAAATALLAAADSAARRGDHPAARTAAGDALALWRGDALADLRAIPFAAVEGERLDALRLELQVVGLTADVAIGASGDVRARLAELAHQYPLDERVLGLLAVALYQSGRQADALAELAGLKARLAEELGVDPSRETSALELRLLRQDADLLPARAARLPTLRLPIPAGSFVGRDAECAALEGQLAAPALVTLTGPPGSGKTRLALELAERASHAGRPVVWVDLSPVPDADAVPLAVASACAVEPGQELATRLASSLTDGLLVLDNAEHVVDAVAALVGAVTTRAAGLSVLTTSQRPLLVAGEEIHQVGPLPASAAATVFCERSHSVRDEQVDAICRAVDCLPLGIELAAGLTRALSVAQIAARIDDRLRLLVGGPRDGAGRHTSLRAALDWSYRLLDEPARAVLRRLAVFAGGATLEAAEAVTGFDPVPPGAVAAVLAELDERCLLSVTGRGTGPRFDLLESVRAYAAELLATDTDDDGATRARHLVWCRAHVTAHDVQGADSPAALDAVFAEWPNLRAALDSALGTERAADAARLAVELDDAWMYRGLHNEARRHYAALVDAPGLDDAERARALSNYAFASTLAGDHDVAQQLLVRAGVHADAAGDPSLRMRVLYHRGIALVEQGRPVDALAPLRAGASIAAEEGREQSASAFDDVIATALLHSGDPAAAARLHHSANDSDRRAGRTHGLVRGLVNEAMALMSLGDVDAAERCVTEGLQLARALHDPVAESTLRAVAGQAALVRGDPVEALRVLRSALAELTPGEIDAYLCQLDLADALVVAGEWDDARTTLEAVLAATTQRGVVWLLAQPTLAELARADGDAAHAAAIIRAAEREYDERGFRWPLAVSRLERARRGASGQA